MAGVQGLRKINKHRAGVARVFEQRGFGSRPGFRREENLVDTQLFGQVDLDARAVFQHAEADGVLAADELLVGIDANVKVVVEQVVVGAEGSVCAAQHIGARGDGSADIVARRAGKGCADLVRGLMRGAGREPAFAAHAEHEKNRNATRPEIAHGPS